MLQRPKNFFTVTSLTQNTVKKKVNGYFVTANNCVKKFVLVKLL